MSEKRLTPMMQAIKSISDDIDEYAKDLSLCSGKIAEALMEQRASLISRLPAEREEIGEAFDAGQSSDRGEPNSEHYFNQTFESHE